MTKSQKTQQLSPCTQTNVTGTGLAFNYYETLHLVAVLVGWIQACFLLDSITRLSTPGYIKNTKVCRTTCKMLCLLESSLVTVAKVWAMCGCLKQAVTWRTPLPIPTQPVSWRAKHVHAPILVHDDRLLIYTTCIRALSADLVWHAHTQWLGQAVESRSVLPSTSDCLWPGEVVQLETNLTTVSCTASAKCHHTLVEGYVLWFLCWTMCMTHHIVFEATHFVQKRMPNQMYQSGASMLWWDSELTVRDTHTKCTLITTLSFNAWCIAGSGLGNNILLTSSPSNKPAEIVGQLQNSTTWFIATP